MSGLTEASLPLLSRDTSPQPSADRLPISQARTPPRVIAGNPRLVLNSGRQTQGDSMSVPPKKPAKAAAPKPIMVAVAKSSAAKQAAKKK